MTEAMTMHMGDCRKVSEMKPLNSRLSLAISSVPKTLFRDTCFVLVVLLLLPKSAPAQINCGAGSSAPSTSLACLVPVSLTPSGFSPASPLQQAPLATFPSNTLAFLSGQIGAEVSQIPLASPASGLIYATNPTTHLPHPFNPPLS